MKKQKPINLDMTTFRLPLVAFVSIFHRISGVVLFVLVGALLYLFQCSLESQQTFNHLVTSLQSPLGKFLIWVTMSALIYHFVAGIKHLLLDMDIADTREKSKIAAIITLIISFILILGAGVWLW